jgi:hypothetical protein
MTRPVPCCDPANAGLDWHSDNVDDRQRAQRLCQPCPDRQACLDGARERDEGWGVWGGVLFGTSGQAGTRKHLPVVPAVDAATASREQAAARRRMIAANRRKATAENVARLSAHWTGAA